MGGGFIYLMVAIHVVGLSKPMPMLVMILSYVFFASGELFIGPLGISMVGRLSPKRCEGFFMGVWQMVQGIAVLFTAMVAGLTVMPKHIALAQSNAAYSTVFSHIGLITIGIGIIALIAAPKIKKLL
jgi:POT family proton-dependent oligopeptide transporter